MNELTAYENYQLLKWGNIIPETPDTSVVNKDWFEREMEIKEYENLNP